MAVSEGVYEIRFAKATGMALDVPGSSKDNGANIQLWTVNHSNAQVFYLDESDTYGAGGFSIRNVYSGKYVTVPRWNDGSYHPNLKPMRVDEGFTVDGYAIGVCNELRQALKGLVENE